MKKQSGAKITGTFMLVIAAFIWGTTFVVQSIAMSDIGPFTFSAIRSFIGAAFLIPVYLIVHRREKHYGKGEWSRERISKTLRGGVVCGVILYVSVNLQQVGLISASPGKTAFLTALYILIVPVLGLFFGKKIYKSVWLGVGISIVGFYLLNITPGAGFGLTFAELLVFFCAIAFSAHILAVEKYGRDINALLLCGMQFFVMGALSAFSMWIDSRLLEYEIVTAQTFQIVWFEILYAGILSSGVAYTLQIAGQKRLPSSVASLIMSVESVFAVSAAWVVRGDTMTVIQITGCALILCAIILSQISGRVEKSPRI